MQLKAQSHSQAHSMQVGIAKTCNVWLHAMPFVPFFTSLIPGKCIYGTRPVSSHPLGAISVSC